MKNLTSRTLTKKQVKNLFGVEFDLPIFAFETKNDLVPEIDPNYLFDKNTTKSILAALCYNKNALIHGLHGSGKTTHIEQIAARLNWPVIRINLDGYITRLELIGRDQIIIKDGKQITYFKEGLLAEAIKGHNILIFDEYDAAKADVLFVIQRLLEHNSKLTILEKNETLIPHKFFRLFATANTIGGGDEYGIYHGTNFLNQAQLDRWNLVINLDNLSSKNEIKLLNSKYKSLKDSLDFSSIIEFTNLLRDGFKSGRLNNLITLRTIFSWIENFQIFKNLEDAFKLSFYNRLDSGDKKVIAEIYQRIFDAEL